MALTKADSERSVPATADKLAPHWTVSMHVLGRVLVADVLVGHSNVGFRPGIQHR